MHHNTIVASHVNSTRQDATQRQTLTVTDLAITHLTRTDNLDKFDDDEKVIFIWFVLVGRNLYVLSVMASSCADHLEEITTPGSQ